MWKKFKKKHTRNLHPPDYFCAFNAFLFYIFHIGAPSIGNRFTGRPGKRENIDARNKLLNTEESCSFSLIADKQTNTSEQREEKQRRKRQSVPPSLPV
ncbi:hypothetical protein [uncultured Bacteroides sp.]|uniref:hypothetical protein n=1 Tax=uncultured Bacteroides sp. TaxID=162156 RepID=UPI0025F9EC62|nr:hypothetical protein [uncultured Bacteroides sp.]